MWNRQRSYEKHHYPQKHQPGGDFNLPDSTFVVLLCGLLVTKIMALTALLLFLTYRAQVSAGIVGVAEVAAPGPTKTPGPLSTPH